MSAAPLVSIILPCYNAHRYLGQTIDSVRNQTFADIEIIVVNDGSNDPETLAYLETLPKDIKVVHHENRGLPAARNTGFETAAGKYVMPLDCDDWLEPEFLEVSLDVLERTPDASFVFSNLALEGELRGELAKSYNYFEQLFLNQLPYALLLPKELWKAVGGCDPTMRDGYEDWEFNIRLGAHGYHGVGTRRALMHYRVSSQGMLLAKSSALHGKLWRKIQKKHPELYTFTNLVRTWREWRHHPSSYPLPLYFVWFCLFRTLPQPVFGFMFRQVLKLSKSRRISAAQTRAASNT